MTNEMQSESNEWKGGLWNVDQMNEWQMTMTCRE
jgi:hypothetical protein